MAETGEGAAEVVRKTLSHFEEEGESGLDLTCDVIPDQSCADFTQTSIGYFLKSLLMMTGTRSAFAEKWRNPQFRREFHSRIKNGELTSLDKENEACKFPKLYILKYKNTAYQRKSVVQCAEEIGAGIQDAIMGLFVEHQKWRLIT